MRLWRSGRTVPAGSPRRAPDKHLSEREDLALETVMLWNAFDVCQKYGATRACAEIRLLVSGVEARIREIDSETDWVDPDEVLP